MPFIGLDSLRAGVALVAIALLATGCGSLHGPSLDVTAPRLVGRAVDARTGQPVTHARVGRRLSGWRSATGGFPRGAEELLLLQDEVRTGGDGRFVLAGRSVALLFSLGDPGLDLDLSIRHGAYRAWRTNYPISALANDPTEARIDAGEIRLDPR
jgi:hypothetical protein